MQPGDRYGYSIASLWTLIELHDMLCVDLVRENSHVSASESRVGLHQRMCKRARTGTDEHERERTFANKHEVRRTCTNGCGHARMDAYEDERLRTRTNG